jgi:hypothetical protein
MFDDLDATLLQLLTDAAIPPALGALRAADISFEPPDRSFTPPQDTLNLYLVDIKENRVLRDAVPFDTRLNGSTTFRRPPLRVDCTYLVTAWSANNGGARAAAEHRLLAQALLWMGRFTTLPQVYRVGGLAVQPFDPLMVVAQDDPTQNDYFMFWSAMGITPRAAFYATVTITMELNVAIEAPLVTTLVAWYQQDGRVESREEWITIAGRVLDRGGNAAPRVKVTLRPTSQVAETDAQGIFRLARVLRGDQYVLTASAAGLGSASLPTQIPSLTGEYNLQLT